jgi:ribosomal protein L11 methyltransferase
MRWAEIQVDTTAQAQEAVANLMMESGCGGVAIQGEAPIAVTCYLPVDDRLEQKLIQMRDSINSLPSYGIETGGGEVTIRYAEDQDWAEAWKSFFHVTRVGKRIVIKPSWEEFTPETKDIVIEIDPGMAFGTGSHATTQLCLRALEKYVKPRMTVVDFGAGTGILAIAAAKLRASLVIAFDADELAVKAARFNVLKNEMEHIIEVHQTDNSRFINRQVDLVTANIVAETIIENAEQLANLLRLGGILIASGITRAKTLNVEQALRNVGFDIAERMHESGWAALIAIKGS